MGEVLYDIPFDEWVAHVFDHKVRVPQWYFDIDSDDWDGPSQITVTYITRLFENPERYLEKFSDEQLEQGFWYLSGTSEYMFALLDQCVPMEERTGCIRSFYLLFEQLFARRCSPHLSHIDEAGANPLNGACYMWWDNIPICGEPNDRSRHDIDREILDVMNNILSVDSVACQESSLHGLGHWEMYYSPRVHDIIDAFLADRQFIRKELADYAKQARRGYVL